LLKHIQDKRMKILLILILGTLISVAVENPDVVNVLDIVGEIELIFQVNP
jgi:hypothetical protein